MRTLFDIEEEEEVETKASEITLGTASLLGIFFGLVLVCGVFFGFGYSLGRGTAWVSQASKLSDSQTAAKDDLSPAPTPAADTVAAPVAADQPETAKAAAPLPPIKTEMASEDSSTKPEAVMGDTPAKPATLAKPAPGKEAPAYTPPMGADEVSYTGKPMVQIAAVARPQDAYALVTALRQHGYGAMMRSDPQDKLVHVQVGPFADRSQAFAMRDKLLRDGYNAIIKQ